MESHDAQTLPAATTRPFSTTPRSRPSTGASWNRQEGWTHLHMHCMHMHLENNKTRGKSRTMPNSSTRDILEQPKQKTDVANTHCIPKETISHNMEADQGRTSRAKSKTRTKQIHNPHRMATQPCRGRHRAKSGPIKHKTNNIPVTKYTRSRKRISIPAKWRAHGGYCRFARSQLYCTPGSASNATGSENTLQVLDHPRQRCSRCHR